MKNDLLNQQRTFNPPFFCIHQTVTNIWCKIVTFCIFVLQKMYLLIVVMYFERFWSCIFVLLHKYIYPIQSISILVYRFHVFIKFSLKLEFIFFNHVFMKGQNFACRQSVKFICLRLVSSVFSFISKSRDRIKNIELQDYFQQVYFMQHILNQYKTIKQFL